MYSFRKNAHTGENRCWPCTVTNLVIATVVAAGLSLFSPLLGAAFLLVGVSLIGFVGYLVPGTPYLTKRYFPRQVLSWFGKEPAHETIEATDGNLDGTDADGGEDVEIDVDWLIDVGALAVESDDSLSIDAIFEERWKENIDALRNREWDQREAFAGIVDVDPGDVAFEEVEQTGAFTVRVNGHDVSQWMSKAAFVSDLGASATLTTLDEDWTQLSLQERHELLVGLRQFLDTCPSCGGTLVEGTEVIESCCWSMNATTARCDDCDSRMYVVAGE